MSQHLRDPAQVRVAAHFLRVRFGQLPSGGSSAEPLRSPIPCRLRQSALLDITGCLSIRAAARVICGRSGLGGVGVASL